MSHIFLSYSRRDADYVDALSEQVEASGFRTWVDRKGMAGGEQWRQEIVSAIRSASLFALFLSPNSTRSENVRKELDLAEQARVRILPVAISAVEIPAAMQYQLAGIQLVELWRDYDRAVGTLTSALDRQGVPRSGAGVQPRRIAAPSDTAAQHVDLADLGGSRFFDLANIKRLFRPR